MEKMINKSDVEKILRKLWKEDNGESSESRIVFNEALQKVQIELDALEEKEERFVIVPEDKMKVYMNYMKGKKYQTLCDCGKEIEIECTPYYYDKEENDVYFASLCPECGKLIITKE